MSIFARNALLVLGAYHEGNPCGILLQCRQTVTVMPWNFRRLWNSLTLFGPPTSHSRGQLHQDQP